MMAAQPNSIREQVHKMQSMLDRYHTNHYIRQEEQRLAKFQQRRAMLEETLGKGKISWADFKVDLEVKTQQ